MSIRPGVISLIFGGLLAFVAAQADPLPDPVFTQFVAPFPIGGAPIGFAYAGNKFVGTVQRDGINVLYSTNLTGGNVQPFGGSVSLSPSPSAEHFVAASLGLGGFPNRDIYVASGTGVVHISNDGSSSNTFVSGLNGFVRGILFDPVGTFSHNMLITTNTGSIYEVDSAGTPTLIATTHEDTEGLDVAPLGGNLGAFNGQLIVASEGSNTIRAINPTTHAVSVVVVAPQIGGAEELSVVPLDLGSGDPALEGMYGANYSLNVVKADASQFAGLQGDIIVTGEFGHAVWDIHFNGTNFVVTQVGTFPNQPEDGIFVTSAIITGGGTTGTPSVPEPGSLLLLGTAIACLGGWRLRNRSTDKKIS